MSWASTPFIRPLLNFKKSELQDYLKRNNLNWMEDPSNKSLTYLRNRVRLELIPLLEELTRKGLQSRMLDLIDQSKILGDWLNSNYKEWSKINVGNTKNTKEFLCISELIKVEKILQHEILHNFISEYTGQFLSYRKLTKILDLICTKKEPWELHLSGDWKIFFSSGKLRLKNNSSA